MTTIQQLKTKKEIKITIAMMVKKKLNELCNEKTWTVKELSKISGVNYDVMSKIKNFKKERYFSISANILARLYDSGIIRNKDIQAMDKDSIKFLENIIKIVGVDNEG